MTKERGRSREGFVQHDLLGRVRDMVITADNMGDAHVDIVYYNRKMVRWMPIGAKEHKIINAFVFQRDFVMHQILEGSFTRRNQKTDREGFTRLLFYLFRCQTKTNAFILPGSFRLHPGFTARIQFLRLAKATVCLLVLNQVERSLAIQVQTLRLVKRTFVPVEYKPLHAVQNDIDHFIGGSLHIGIFNPKNKCSLLLSCIQPVVKSCAGASDMQITGGTWRKSKTKGRGLIHFCKLTFIHTILSGTGDAS